MSDDRGRIMLAIARGAISFRLGNSLPADEGASWLNEPGACFVTLTMGGGLRGCIGSLEPYRSLLNDLKENALAAAFRDPRFPPLSRQELESVRIEVSLLSPVVPLTFRDEDDAMAQLRPGLDGVILEFGPNRGTFLPQVWEQLPTPRDFLLHLKRKAGLPSNFWKDGLRLYRYSVDSHREEPQSRR